MRLAPSTKEKIDFFLRHPLTLSLTGMLLGSLLIPWIVGRSSKQAAVADTRLKQALQVMATSNGVDATINKMETAFEGFEKDSLLIEQQDELLRRHFFHPFLSYQPVSRGVEMSRGSSRRELDASSPNLERSPPALERFSFLRDARRRSLAACRLLISSMQSYQRERSTPVN